MQYYHTGIDIALNPHQQADLEAQHRHFLLANEAALKKIWDDCTENAGVKSVDRERQAKLNGIASEQVCIGKEPSADAYRDAINAHWDG